MRLPSFRSLAARARARPRAPAPPNEPNQFLATALDHSTNEQLLVLIVIFLKKLSIFEENKEAMRERGVVAALVRRLTCSSEPFALSALRCASSCVVLAFLFFVRSRARPRGVARVAVSPWAAGCETPNMCVCRGSWRAGDRSSVRWAAGCKAKTRVSSWVVARRLLIKRSVGSRV